MSAVSIKQRQKEQNFFQRVLDKGVKGGLESAFNAYGKFATKKWWVVLIVSLCLFGLCMMGRLRMTTETDERSLWVPKNSDFKYNSDWISDNYPEDTRNENILVFAENGNILTSKNINALYELHQSITNIKTEEHSATWEKKCERRKVPGVTKSKCVFHSILELFMTNGEFDDVSNWSDQDILDQINDPNAVSGLTGQPMTLPTLLGKIKLTNGKISEASAVLMSYTINFDEEYSDTEDQADPETLEFEKYFIDTVNEFRTKSSDLKAYPNAQRSYGDIAGETIDGDLLTLTMGFGIVAIYVMVILGKFNSVQNRALLSLVGIACVGMGFVSAEGACAAFGLASSPMNSILPFMLLGIGIDDMFVIVQSFDNADANAPLGTLLVKKFGSCMKHAGVAITITSVTDILAFGVGASTILPALRSFCIFSAAGILFVFIYMITFFLPLFVLDQKRQEGLRDAFICCWKKKNWTPNSCSQKSVMKVFFDWLGNVLTMLPIKVVVLGFTASLTGLTVWGLIGLETEFDFRWYITDGSYLRNYFDYREEYFPISGIPGQIYIGEVPDFETKFGAIKKMVKEASEAEYLSNVDGGFIENLELYIDEQLGSDTFPKTALGKDEFYEYLHQFLCSSGAAYQRQIQFKDNKELSCSGVNKAPEINILTIFFRHKSYDNAKETIEKINEFEDLILKHKPDIGSEAKVFSYSFLYADYKTTEIISQELVRNVLLALLCVFIATLILIANPFTSIIVVFVVFLTLVNVGGFMNFWGLTIDTLTAVLITISLGLAVDYSAHIAHSFMVFTGTRDERVKQTMADIGPAVLNGGFSTYLAFALLMTSKSYIFITFFKVFLLIVIFGLYNGLIFLPVILSLIGPGSTGKRKTSVEPIEPIKGPDDIKPNSPVQKY